MCESWVAKTGPLIIHAKFLSKSEVVFFAGVFTPQMESKNYKFRRIARELQDKRSGF
jgi:hypothetical protein